jgi:hypothetical protein
VPRRPMPGILSSRMNSPAAATTPRKPRARPTGRGRKPAPRARNPAPAPFRALIVYADVPAARRAMTEIRNVLLATGRAYEFCPMLWRFDQLAGEHWREVALRDAAEAAIVVLASTDSAIIPAGLECWVSSLLARKQGLPITIVAVLGATEAWTISIEKPQQPAKEVSKEAAGGASITPAAGPTTAAVCAA